ncbi:Something about silencing protein 10 [Trametes pubescens]|uniref:Something about silencing protein 10 n=1 Tax=Trametes pubescens TaxID=154538 RepID=A0A1M2VKE8_TRAPU|nr:Something about silencing protein 10 [Trametes pubescens]
MVRRRSGKGKVAQSKPRSVDRKDSKMRKWNKASDVPMDEEDQFHASRDQILLEGNEDGGSEDGDEDEVFALKGVDSDGSADEDSGGAAEDDEDDIDDVHYAAAAAAQKEKEKKAKAKKAKGKKGKQDAPPSSEESASDSEEDEGWGTQKAAYYSSNAQEIDSEDEETNELEEAEARRLQGKARDAMADDDFGLGDVVEGLPDADGIADEFTAPAAQPLPQDKQSLLRHLEKTNPEALALANDWDDVAHSLVKAQANIAKLEAKDPSALGLSMMHLHHQALLTYATTLAFYLHLRTSEKYIQRPDLLRAHPILPRLLKLKQSLATLEDLDFAASDASDASDMSGLSDEEDEDVEDLEDDAMDSDDLMADAEALWAGSRLKKKGKGLERGELEDLLREASDLIDGGSGAGADSPPKKAKRRQNAAAKEPPKKKRKAADARAQPVPPAPVFDLVEPELDLPRSTAKGKRRADEGTGAEDVYGEASALDVADAADKQARKKTLRFHTARIESTAARRAGARSGAVGGDDDIPYRERKRAKEARLAKEVAKTRGADGADLDDVDPEAEMPAADGKQAKKRRRDESESGSDGEGGAADGYYELVQRKSKETKEKKKHEHDAVKAAGRYVEVEEADGPRSLTRAILKNKGLTPHRPKSVRNPRVKKRQKYEKAKKRVSSQKATYKGGMDASRYAGEKTGISQTAKGVRL